MSKIYDIYARKSSEGDDRQIASINDQLKELKVLSQRRNITIGKVFTESMSAKKPGRPVFNELLERVRRGETNGIICWKLNRLARNPIDGGLISWLLQENKLEHIITSERDYYPKDNVLLMQIDFGIATQYVKDLSHDVKRGLRQKALRGWYPITKLPVGYIHNPRKELGKDEIINDPERFNILKKLWEMFATGIYAMSEIREQAKLLGLKNPKGGEYAYSSFHRIFSNPFYSGYFHWKDDQGINQKIQGKHEPMVDLLAFNKVQRILSKKGVDTRANQYSFSYKGILSCGECSGNITAERKLQVICTGCKRKFSCIKKTECPLCNLEISKMKNPSKIDITYYHCTKNKYKNCTQGSITEKKLHTSFAELLSKIEITKSFYDFSNKKLKVLNQEEKNLNLEKQLQKELKQYEIKKERLLHLRMDGEISKEEFSSLKSNLDQKIQELEISIEENKKRHELAEKEVSNYLNFAYRATEKFKTATKETKKAMITSFASNLRILDKSLCFSTKKPHSVVNMLLRSYGLK